MVSGEITTYYIIHAPVHGMHTVVDMRKPIAYITPMDKATRRIISEHMAELGRRGGKHANHRLSSDKAREMARIRWAKRRKAGKRRKCLTDK